jgi:hypothetical protein
MSVRSNPPIGGGSAGGATIALGTAAARPGTPATDFYFATDTLELSLANAAKSAWLGIGQISGAFAAGAAGGNVIAGINNFGLLGVGGTQSGFKLSANRMLLFGDSLNVTDTGKGLAVKEGANCKQGIATLVAGTVVVANTSVTANSRIFLTCNNPGGTPGFLRVSARTAGTSFTILSSSGTDTSDVAWEIFEPSP